jgi:hypothetical protein
MMLQHNRLRLLLEGTHVTISLANVVINAISSFSLQMMLQHDKLRLLLKGTHVNRSLDDIVVNVSFSYYVTAL